MRRKYLLTAACAMMIAVITGCGSKDVSPKPVEIETQSAAAEVEQETQASTEEAVEETVDVSDIFESLTYQVFDDGEPHYVMYYADAERNMFNTFSTIHYPEYGIDTVSFISPFVNVPEEDIRSYINDHQVLIETDDDLKAVFDMTTSALIKEEGYHRFIPSEGRFGFINRDYPIEGTTPTDEEYDSLCMEYKILAKDEMIEKKTPSGDTVYVKLAKTLFTFIEEDVMYRGATILRFKDGKAQGVYYSLYLPEEKAFDYVDYIVQSLKFAD